MGRILLGKMTLRIGKAICAAAPSEARLCAFLIEGRAKRE